MVVRVTVVGWTEMMVVGTRTVVVTLSPGILTVTTLVAVTVLVLYQWFSWIVLVDQIVLISC